jgi:ribonuclease-3
MSPADTSGLQRSIGYSFTRRDLLLEALTHKSFHHENPEEAPAHNERLEFLGDSVLGLIVARYLFAAEGGYPESMMSKIKAQIVKGAVLSEVAREISLGDYLRLGKGEEETGGRQKTSILSNALESLLGAVYMDGGYEEARGLILRLFKERLDRAMASGQFHDYKTELQEESQVLFRTLPEYRLVKEEGKEHKKIFTVEVFISGTGYGTGRGKSKKEAQALAARKALEKIREGRKH